VLNLYKIFEFIFLRHDYESVVCAIYFASLIMFIKLGFFYPISTTSDSSSSESLLKVNANSGPIFQSWRLGVNHGLQLCSVTH